MRCFLFQAIFEIVSPFSSRSWISLTIESSALPGLVAAEMSLPAGVRTIWTTWLS